MTASLIESPIKNGLLEQAVEGVTQCSLSTEDSALAAVNKAVAMFLFSRGITDLSGAQAAFIAHPDWRAA